MEATKDESYGVVPVIKKDGDWYVLLINQISHKGEANTFWTFPKGHPDSGETPVETAKRELLEETGKSNVRIIEEAEFPISYTFRHEGDLIEKTVSYYLGVCADTEFTITQPQEVAGISWLKFDEAMVRLSHKNTQDVLLSAGQFITTHEDTL